MFRIEDVLDPRPGAGQIAMSVQVASITFVDTQVRAGRPPNPAMLPTLPVILGNGVGGVVASVGPGADEALIGRRVISSLNGTGGYAEAALADAANVVDIPDQLDTAEAAALLADGRTAMLLMRTAQVRGGESVLILAAAGGVGSLLVQLAHNAGARVIGAAGGARKAHVARALGADVDVDYSDPGWTAPRLQDVDGVDVVFDGVGGSIGRAAFDVVRSGGRFSSFGMASGAFAAVSDDDAAARQVSLIRGGRPSPDDLRDLVRQALAEAVAGRLRPLIGQTFPLERVVEAHAAMEQRATIGKTLLTF